MAQHLLLGNNIKINTKNIKAAYKAYGIHLKVHGNGKKSLDCSKLSFDAGDSVMIFAKSEVSGKKHYIDLCMNTIKNQQTYEVFKEIFPSLVNIELFTNNADLVSEDVKHLADYSTLMTLNGPNNYMFDAWGEQVMLSIFDVFPEL